MINKILVTVMCGGLCTAALAEETADIFYEFPNSEINFEALYSNPANGSACVGDFNEDGFPDLIVAGPNYDDFNMAYVNLLLNDKGKGFIRHDLRLQAVNNGSIAATKISEKEYVIALQGGIATPATNSNAVGYVAKLDLKSGSPVVTKLQDLDYGLIDGDIMFLDFNGDGKDDIVQFGGGKKVYSYLNDGNNKFILNSTTTNLKGTNKGECRLHDMDGDGRKDIVAIDQNSGFYVYINKGNGSFDAKKLTSSYKFKNNPRIGIGDFDNDGHADIVAFDYNSINSQYSVVFFYGNSAGGWDEAPSNDFMGVGTASVAVADFNGDGNLDVLYSGVNNKVRKSDSDVVNNAKAYMLLGDGKRNFVQNVKWNIARNCPDIFCLAPVKDGHYYTADFDGDGIADVFALGELGVPMGGKNLRRADMFLSSLTYGFGKPIDQAKIAHKWEGFPYSEVRLVDSRLSKAMEKEIAYLKSLDINRLYASTLDYNLGIKGYKPYGGWEESGYGSTFSHYTSALAMAYAATGDKELLDLVNKSVSIMRQCQDYNGDGFFAFKDGTTWGFDKMAKEKIIKPYGWDENGHPWGNNDIGFPLYAHHKIFAALRDAYVYAGNEDARVGFIKFCDWLVMWVQNFDDENLNKMLESEHGGIVEILADAYALSGQEKFLAAARRFTRKNFANTMSNNIDDLSGRHSNFHIPMALGSAVHYHYSGDNRSRLIGHNFFHIVNDHHTLCNGGNGNNERFGTPDLLTYRLGVRGPETCSSYNMLKLAKELFCQEGTVDYLDYYENTMWNHILGTLSPNEGEGVCYHTSLKPGTFRCYDNLYNNFWCCVGTGMESHVKYVDAIFFKGSDGLLVNLYTPATLDWTEKGLKLEMDTKYPSEDNIRIRIEKNTGFDGDICFRYPAWAKVGSMKITVNGTEQSIDAKPGEIVSVTSDWKAGDEIVVTIPAYLRLVDLPDDVNVSAIFYGPIMLGGVLESIAQNNVGIQFPDKDITDPAPMPYFPVLKHSRDNLGDFIKVVDLNSLKFETVGLEKNYSLQPFYDIHDNRYNVYWKIADEKDEADVRELVVDHVIPGDADNEDAHNVVSTNSGTGFASFNFWGQTYFYYRNASITGSIQYDMSLLDRQLVDDEQYYLQVTYFGDEPSGYGGFRIYVDGNPIAYVESIERLARLDFAQRYYAIPRKYTDGKKKVTVLFSGGRTSIYGLRITLSDNLVEAKKDHESSGVESILPEDGHNIWCGGRSLHLAGFDGGSVRIYDTNGALMESAKINGAHDVINLSLKKGIYIAQVVSLQGVETRKIIIE